MGTSEKQDKHHAQIRNQPYKTVTHQKTIITEILFVITHSRESYIHIFSPDFKLLCPQETTESIAKPNGVYDVLIS